MKIPSSGGHGNKLKVAVIGTGFSGLAAIKECLDEGQKIEVVGFEKGSFTGGLWRYVDVSEKNPNPHSSVYKSTVVNTSAAMMYACPFQTSRFLEIGIHTYRKTKLPYT
ncbi:Cyclopentanone 1,2-monooxygenase (CPMO) [Mortierella sp. AD094]|nr:Cyclopentanone 1,2-monooxygenase (CPMO) [Mortierella sp. AD094]